MVPRTQRLVGHQAASTEEKKATQHMAGGQSGGRTMSKHKILTPLWSSTAVDLILS